MEPESPRRHKSKSQEDLPRRRKRSSPPLPIKPVVLVAAFSAILVVWILPTLLGYTGLVSWIANRSASELNGRIVVQSASLGWFSPVRAYGVKIVDPEGREVVEMPEVYGNRALVGLLWNAANVGRFRVVGPKVSLVLRDDGSNLEDLLANYLAKRERKKIDVAVEVADGSLSIEDSRTRRTWQVENLQVDFALPSDRSLPVELTAAGMLAGAQRGGGFEAAMRIQQDRSVGDAAADPPAGEPQGQETESAGPDSISLKAEGLSLAVFEPVVRRVLPGTRLAGRLTADLQCKWDSRRPDGRAKLQAKATAEDMQLSGPMLGKDQPALKRLQAEGLVAWERGLVQFDRITAESDLGTLSLSGAVDLTGQGRAAARHGYELKGQLDLVRLAALLPDTLRIQKDTQVTSGRAQVSYSSRPGREGMTWNGRLEVTDLTASSGARRVVWRQPVLIDLSARETAEGPVIENLKCQSSFLNLQASGTPSRLTGSATFDAGKLAEQLRGFVDLRGMRLAGDGWSKLDWSRTADGRFDAGVQLRINGFQWALPDRPAWTEDALTLAVSATGRAELGGQSRLDTATAKIESGSDLVEVRLAEPVADFRGSRPLPLEVHSRGQLARWPGRLAIWFPIKDCTAGGSYDLVAGATVSTGTVALTQTRLEADNLEVRSPQFVLREPKTELTLAGRYDWTSRRVELASLTVACASLSAQATKLVWALPPQGPAELTGSVTFQAALDRIHAWTAVDPKVPPSWRMAGQLAAKADFQQSAGLISSRFDGRITDLDIVHRSGQRYQEREIRFVGQGSYNDVSRSIHIEQAEFTSTAARGTLAGKMAGIGSPPDVDLSGRVDYDLDRITLFLRSFAGDGVRLGGRGSSPFSYRGVWGSDNAVATGALSWNWAQLYGFQLGAGQLEASLTKGLLDVKPLNVECNEGHLTVAPQVRLAGEAKEIAVPAGRIVDQVRITPAMCASLLQYIAPLLAGVTTAEGRFSIDLEGCRLPLGNEAGLIRWPEAEIAGKLVIHSAQIGPGFLIRELAQLFGSATPAYLIRESAVPFRVTKGRIYHQQMELAFSDVTLRSYGSVGFDQSLSLMVEVPVPPKWQTSKLLGTALKDQTIKLPIVGSLRQPKIDRTAFDQITRQIFQGGTQNMIQSGLNKILGPLPKR